jgi:DNA-binding MarR family transcriptional regulator
MSNPDEIYQLPTGANLAEELGRDLGARTVNFHQAVADRLGISITDHKCLDIAQRSSRNQTVTAGMLAEQTGLTTGAITGVLDRLEKAGFIRREKHPNDRRQVVVRVLDDRAAEFDEIFGPMQKAWEQYCRRFDPEQLAVIREFVAGAKQLLIQHTERLRQQPLPGARLATGVQARPGETLSSASLGNLSEGRLELVRGAAHLGLSTCDDDRLYHARFARQPARVNVDGGVVSVTQKHGFMNFLSSEPGEIKLNERIPWSIRVKGGSHKLEADLRRLQLMSLEMLGGVSETNIRLPSPSGTVSVRVLGGMSRLLLQPPEGVPFRLLAKGGCSQLLVERLQLGAVGGDMRWESPEFASARDRYDFDIRGGASELSIVPGAAD